MISRATGSQTSSLGWGKQLLAIAFLWGLARVSGRKLPVAIDTPLGRLDSSHRTNLVERYFLEPVTKSFSPTDTEIGK